MLVYFEKYEAAEGKVWDYVNPPLDEEGNPVHLYSKIIYLGKYDSISNYIEVELPE